MSHIVKVTTQIKDEQIVSMACESLKLSAPVKGEHQLYQDQVSGLGVQLPGWKYPVVYDLKTGQAKYDNYGGSWGAQSELDRFHQEYGVQTTRQVMHEQGHIVESQEVLEDGSVRLRIPVYA